MNNLPKTRDNNVITQETGAELLVYDLKSNKAICLNETSAKVWQLCDGKNSCEQISRQTQIPKEFVWIAIEEFQKNQLLETPVKTELPVNAFSRRKLLFKVGTTAVSLPIITAIIAPKSIEAASATCSTAGLVTRINLGPTDCSECPGDQSPDIVTELNCCQFFRSTLAGCTNLVCNYTCVAL